MASSENRNRSRLYLANGMIWFFIALGLLALGLRSRMALTDSNLLVLGVPTLVILVASHFLFMFLFKRNIRRIEKENSLSRGSIMDSWSLVVVIALLFLVIVLNPVNETWTYLMTVICGGLGLGAIEPAVKYLLKLKTN